MSEPAQRVRLHLLLSDGLAGLSRVVDRLSVVGVLPEVIVFRRGTGKRVFLHLVLDETSLNAAHALADRMKQVIAVSCLRLSRGMPEQTGAQKSKNKA